MSKPLGLNGCVPPPPQAKSGDPIPNQYPFANAPAFPTTIGQQPEGIGQPSDAQPPGFRQWLGLHSCMGLNACLGMDRFGVSTPSVCAGQGYCATSGYGVKDGDTHTCHVKNSCKNQGGCGLYGTGAELNSPGLNDCQSLGSCAVPINAERFSTVGPNKGKSVWVRARQVFESNWPQLRQQLQTLQAQGKISKDLPLPEKLGPPPQPFAASGPPYLWITNDNQQRGNMTSCGASGLSGAGGCG